MEEVVYIIGAGFSAVAGLPVMGTTPGKSKRYLFEGARKVRAFQAGHRLHK